MSVKSLKSIKSAKTRHYASLDDLPVAPPLSSSIKRKSDRKVWEQASNDPDAEELPDAFWAKAEIVEPEGTEQITLRLPRRVLRHFRDTGKGYQSRISAVLSTYVDATSRTSREKGESGFSRKAMRKQ